MSEIWINNNGQWIYYATVEQGSFDARCMIDNLEANGIAWRYQ